MDLNNPWLCGVWKRLSIQLARWLTGLMIHLGFHLNYLRFQIWVISLQNLRVCENLQPPLPGFFCCRNRIFREVHSFLLHTSKGSFRSKPQGSHVGFHTYPAAVPAVTQEVPTFDILQLEELKVFHLHWIHIHNIQQKDAASRESWPIMFRFESSKARFGFEVVRQHSCFLSMTNLI